ncbi:hypothetical protein FDK38_002912 [Candidozyma auris]|nr:hypothetical protein FDK38_002912 [[Candida] auris]
MFPLIYWLVSWVALVAADTEQALKLTELSLSIPDGVIPISNGDLSAISEAHREHYTLIALTSTDPKHDCESCRDLEAMLSTVAKAWFADHTFSNYLFFAKIDIADRSNKPVFDYLQLKSVPQVWLVPPSAVVEIHSKKKRPVDEDGQPIFGKYDMLLEPHAEFEIPNADLNTQTFQLADWLAHAIQKRIYLRQENPHLKFIVAFASTFASILYLKKRGPSFLTNTVSKTLIYKIITLTVLLVILGGYSFTTIEGIAFLARDSKGKIMYVSGSLNWQFGDEIVLVGGHYFMLGATLALMVYLGQYKVGSEKVIANEQARFVLTFAAAGMLYLVYSSLTSMFLRKDPDYPYHLLKLF